MNRKAQIAPFVLIITVVLIVAIVGTILIGEASFARIRLANAADSTLISAASSFCRSINILRLTNNQLFLSYVGLQIGALASSPWVNKGNAILYIEAAVLLSANTWDSVKEKILDRMAKDLRVKLYESTLAGGLVEEPEPFNVSKGEVIVDPVTGKYTGIDYKKYMARLSAEGSHFSQAFTQYKQSNPGGWWGANKITYSYSKNNITQRGHFSTDPDPTYDSFVSAELRDVPTGVDYDAMELPIFFIWLCPTPWGTIPLPGFGWDWICWIKRLTFQGGSGNFGLSATKRLSYQRLPFLGRDINVTHSNRVRITGGITLFSDAADFQLRE